jgi:hypothetical protein
MTDGLANDAVPRVFSTVAPGSGQIAERPDARQELVGVGEGVGMERHDRGLLIDDPHHAVLLGRRLAEPVDPLAIVVADHDHPRMAGDRVDAEVDRAAAEPRKVEEAAGLVGQGAKAIRELGRRQSKRLEHDVSTTRDLPIITRSGVWQ